MLNTLSNLVFAHVVDRIHHFYEDRREEGHIKQVKASLSNLQTLFVPNHNTINLNLNEKKAGSLVDKFIENNQFRLPRLEGHETSAILRDYQVSNSWIKKYLEVWDWHSFFPQNSQDILRDPNLSARNSLDSLDEDYYVPDRINYGLGYTMDNIDGTLGTMISVTDGLNVNHRLCYGLRGSRVRSGDSQVVYRNKLVYVHSNVVVQTVPTRVYNFSISETKLIAIVLNYTNLEELYKLPSLKIYLDRRYIWSQTAYGDQESGYPTVTMHHEGIITKGISVKSNVILHAFCNEKSLILVDVEKCGIIGDFSIVIDGVGFTVEEIQAIKMEEFYELFS